MMIYNRRILALAGIKPADAPDGWKVGINHRIFFRMLFQRTHDDGYHHWFAWRPVLLKWEGGYGNPIKRYYKVIWLRFVHRKRTSKGIYYSVFEGGKPGYRESA